MIDAETLHMKALYNLERLQENKHSLDAISNLFHVESERLVTTFCNLTFSNPLGVAAGYDKYARAVNALYAFGFSHVEVGTVTPRPQFGNPKSRMFRLSEDYALINRFGFNNEGQDALKQTIGQYGSRYGILGINLGVNKENTELDDALKDYESLISNFHGFADYLVINVSSPNTPKLRRHQEKNFLDEVFVRFMKIRDEYNSTAPVLLKIAPDLTLQEIDEILEVLIRNKLHGIICTNTSLGRPDSLRSGHKHEIGGLSGEPLKNKSTAIIKHIYKQTNGKLPIIGAGGVSNVQDVIEKMQAGASLVQMYTALEFEGPGIAHRVNVDLLRYAQKEGLSNISEIVGKSI